MNRKNKGKISHTLQAISMLPLLVLGMIILLIGYHYFTQTMYGEVKSSLQGVANETIALIDMTYPGDYELVGEDVYQIYKGEQDITSAYQLVDMIKEYTGLDVTLFYQDTRVLTTIYNRSGERIVRTGAADTIMTEVFKADNAHFYNNAIVNGTAYFSYYTPLHNADGSVVGMLFVGKPKSQVDDAVQKSLYPLLIAVLLTIVVMAVLISFYTKGIVRILLKIRDFLSEASKGNVTAEIDPAVLRRNDELGEIGQSILAMQRSLRTMMEQDALTELFNRSSADRKLKQVMAKAAEQDTPFAVAIGDIDYFKTINDTYGHDCGDVALKKVADILKEHMRSCGFVARWGGEEFLLVFDRMNKYDARKQLEKILDSIHHLEIPYENQVIRLTMTFGVTQGEQIPIKDLLRKADSKLYAGKTSGRDKVVS